MDKEMMMRLKAGALLLSLALLTGCARKLEDASGADYTSRSAVIEEEEAEVPVIPTKDNLDQFPATDSDSFTVRLNEDSTGYIIGACSSKDSVISVPDSIRGVPVVEIDKGAFKDNKTAAAIVIPDSVEVIGEGAFNGMESLKYLKLGNGLRSVGSMAIGGSPLLEEVIFPDGLKELTSPFGRCDGLKYVYIPSSAVYIGQGIASRSMCPVMVVHTPRGSQAARIAAQEGFEVAEEEEIKDTGGKVPGVITLYNLRMFPLTDVSAFKGHTSDTGDGFVIDSCTSKDQVINVPASINGLTVVGIGSGAFEGLDAVGIALPETTQWIHSYAFTDMGSLKYIDMGTSLKTVHETAFAGLPSIEEVDFPDSTVELHRPFGICQNLKKVYISWTAETVDHIADKSQCPHIIVYTQEKTQAEKAAKMDGFPVEYVEDPSYDASGASTAATAATAAEAATAAAAATQAPAGEEP